jgi:DNA-binding MarR family transcriptional regulator
LRILLITDLARHLLITRQAITKHLACLPEAGVGDRRADLRASLAVTTASARFRTEEGDQHLAHPVPAARIPVMERKGSV